MQSAEKLWRWPLWALAIFSQAKSFRANPVIGSQLLNRCGLHVARLCMSHFIADLRRTLTGLGLSAADKTTLARDGYIVIRNFLPEETFQRLKQEVASCRGTWRECIQGDTLTQRVLLDETARNDMPACTSLIRSARLLGLMRYTAATFSYPLYFIQRIQNRVRPRQTPDPQRTLHSDTFHPTVKCWLFLCDVDSRNGPFTYATGSHRLTWGRVKWEYHRSCTARTLNDGYSEKGSLRAEPDDLAEMGFAAPAGLSVPANTLVVANTHGFHCRGGADPFTERVEIYGSLRTNPFNPLPGLDLGLLRRLKYRLVNRYFEYQDRRAAERRVRATWHRIDPSTGEQTES